MKFKYLIYGLILITVLSLIFKSYKNQKKTNFIIQSELESKNTSDILSKSLDKDQIHLPKFKIKSKAKGSLPPKRLNKKILDIIDEVKRNKDEILEVDKAINQKVLAILSDQNIKRDEKNRIRYKSTDGNIWGSIFFSEKNNDQTRWLIYSDKTQSLRYLSSYNYFAKNQTAFKERIVTIQSVDPNNNDFISKIDGASVTISQGDISEIHISINDEDLYIYDTVKDIIQVQEYDSKVKTHNKNYSYNHNGYLIE